MDAHRTPRRATLVALVVALSAAVLAISGAFVLAVLVPDATDPAGWGTGPATLFATAMLAGFLASLVAALLGGRLVAGDAGRPGASSDTLILAVFTTIGAGAIALWAFGAGIGLDPRPTWLDPIATVATVIALAGALVSVAIISDRLRRGPPARG
jgi:hypothetical protein